MSASNILHAAGARWKNQLLTGQITRPTSLYLLLRTLNGGANPADAAAGDTLTSNLAEVSTSGTGYARIAIAFNSTNFPETASGNGSLLTAAQQTFNFTGTVNGITHAALCTTADNTGVLIESGALSTTRNVASGDQLKVTATSLIEQGA